MTAPFGTVTFLFTDIEGSTRLWQQDEQAMRAALARHDEILIATIADHGGTVFSTMGDGVAAAFPSARSALDAARHAQACLANEPWPSPTPIRVRMGIHTGEAEQRGGDYFGTAVNRAARLMAVGHGGQVLCSLATAEVAGDGVDLTDLGEHRLRDLDRAIRVFQVGGATFGPPRSLDVAPGNLPVLATSFVGRQLELAAVVEEVRAGRLVTVTGVGGVGKTRLALQAAAEMSAGFVGGAWLCELAAADTGDDMAQVVAAALGVVQRVQMSLAESIIDFLRPRQMLVVLDNCEHLLDAAAELAQAVLAGAPGVRILATSREGLGVAGEHIWPMRSLTLPANPGHAPDSEAVRLFAERARAVAPDFVLDTTTAAAVVEICRRLDGIPLAIELAATRVAVMGPAEIAGHLDERFRLLTGGRRSRVERHQTLRAAVEWSYSLLGEKERAVFDRLGVFPASFDESAAVAICTDHDIEHWDVLDALASLVAKSLVGIERAGDTARYRLLETLRHFARDHTNATGAIEELRRRHAGHYAAFAKEAGAGLMSPDELTWRPRVAAEMDNLRTATSWAFDASAMDDVALGSQILGALVMEAVMHQSTRIHAWALPALPRIDETPAALRPAVLAAAAFSVFLHGELDRALALGRRVLAESEALTPALVVAAHTVTFAALASGDAEEAWATIAIGIAAPRVGAGAEWLAVAPFITRSYLGLSVGDLEDAMVSAEHAVAAARRLRSPTLLANARSIHARLLFEHHPEEALAAAEETIRLVHAGAGDVTYDAALQTAALLRSAVDDHVGAMRAARAAFDYDSRAGNRWYVKDNVAVSLIVLTKVPHGLGVAATLSGAFAGPVLGPFPVFVGSNHRKYYERAVADLPSALGPDALADAQKAGASMTYDEIVDYALTELDRLADLASSGDDRPSVPTASDVEG